MTNRHTQEYVERQEEVIRIPLKALYNLSLPESIEIVGVIVPDNDKWKSGENELYLHIRSFCSPVRRPDTPLCIDKYESFLERYKSFLQLEVERTESEFTRINQELR